MAGKDDRTFLAPCHWSITPSLSALMLQPCSLVRNPTLAPQLQKNETPPTSRDEGLLFLHGLESNPARSPSPRAWSPDFPGAARKAP